MSTPMYDLPDHVWMSVTADGLGPAYDEEFDHWECWCGDVDCMKPEGLKPEYVPREGII